MTSGRVVLRTAVVIAAVIFVQETVLFLYAFGFQFASGDSFSPPPAQFFVESLPGFVISTLVLAVGFGGGVFVSLRWVAPVLATQSWRRVAVNGLLASVLGAGGVLVLRIVQSLLSAVHIGPYPFGYSFTASLNASNVWIGTLGATGSALNPLVYNVPLVVLACVFLKLWRAANPTALEAQDRVSVSA